MRGKGKVERIHRTIDQTLLCGLPGFTGGPRDAAGRLYGPLDDRFAARLRAAGDPVTPVPIEAFAGLFGQWADWYNNERPHDGLDGRTPLQAWQEDPGPLHRLSPDRLRHPPRAHGARPAQGSPGCCRPPPATSPPPAAVTRCCAARPAATCSA